MKLARQISKVALLIRMFESKGEGERERERGVEVCVWGWGVGRESVNADYRYEDMPKSP